MPTPNNSIHQMLQKLLGENYDWNGYLNQDTMPNAKYNDTKLDFGARGASGDTQFDLKARGASRPNSQPPKAGTQGPIQRTPLPRHGQPNPGNKLGQGLVAPKLPPLSPQQLMEPTHIKGIQREAGLLKNQPVMPPKGGTMSLLPNKSAMTGAIGPSGRYPPTGEPMQDFKKVNYTEFNRQKPIVGSNFSGQSGGRLNGYSSAGGIIKNGLGVAGLLSQLMDPGHEEQYDDFTGQPLKDNTNLMDPTKDLGKPDIMGTLSRLLSGATEAEGATITDDNIHQDSNAFEVGSPLDDQSKGITFPNSPIDVDKMTQPQGMQELMSRELGESQIAPSAPGTEHLDEPIEAVPSPKAKYNITAESLLNEGASFPGGSDSIDSQLSSLLSDSNAIINKGDPAQLADTPNWDAVMGKHLKKPIPGVVANKFRG